jgi:hypothetical protein
MNKKYIVFLCSFSSLTQSMGFLRRACAGQMSRRIVPHGARAISPQTPQSTSLHVHNSIDLVKDKLAQYFVERGDDQRNAINKEIKALLAENPKMACWIDPFTNNTLLHFAAAFGNRPVVNFLAEQNPQLLNSRNHAGKTPLDTAEDFFSQAQQRVADSQEICSALLTLMHKPAKATGDK